MGAQPELMQYRLFEITLRPLITVGHKESLQGSLTKSAVSEDSSLRVMVFPVGVTVVCTAVQ